MYETILIGIGLLLLLLTYWKLKDNGRTILIAFLISLSWVLFSGFYNYKTSNYTFHDINFFPLILWTTGLVLLKELYDHFPKMKEWKKWLIVSLIFDLFIIVVEYIGYNTFQIQLNSNYSGFLGLPIMHMPLWGQMYYLLIGPIFLLITKWFKLK